MASVLRGGGGVCVESDLEFVVGVERATTTCLISRMSKVPHAGMDK